MTTGNIGPRPTRPAVDNDVYTILLLIAFLFLLAATIYVAWRAYAMLGGLLPPPGA